MKLPNNYILEKKPVKHARIKVNSELQVRIVIPEMFSEDDINALLKKKEVWIQQSLKKLKPNGKKINLNHNHILFFGERYQYFYSPNLSNKVLINHDHKTINSTIDLHDPSSLVNWYKKEAGKHFRKRVPEIADEYGFQYNRIFIREQRTKWVIAQKK
jgi:predicted metal-dependent hydrolase